MKKDLYRFLVVLSVSAICAAFKVSPWIFGAGLVLLAIKIFIEEKPK